MRCSVAAQLAGQISSLTGKPHTVENRRRRGRRKASLTRGVAVGDTWFEPVTSSVSAQPGPREGPERHTQMFRSHSPLSAMVHTDWLPERLPAAKPGLD